MTELNGKTYKFGNVLQGSAVIDKQSKKTLFKTDCYKAINYDNLKPTEKARIETIDAQREVIVLSKRVSNLIKEDILSTPGYRGLIINVGACEAPDLKRNRNTALPASVDDRSRIEDFLG